MSDHLPRDEGHVSAVQRCSAPHAGCSEVAAVGRVACVCALPAGHVGEHYGHLCGGSENHAYPVVTQDPRALVRQIGYQPSGSVSLDARRTS